MTLNWVIFWILISFWLGTVLGITFFFLTDRYKLDRICKRELQARIEYYAREGDSAVLQFKVTQESEGEWDKPPRVTMSKVSDKLERPPRKPVKGDGWHPE